MAAVDHFFEELQRPFGAEADFDGVGAFGEALDEIGRAVMEGSSPRTALEEPVRHFLQGRSGTAKVLGRIRQALRRQAQIFESRPGGPDASPAEAWVGVHGVFAPFHAEIPEVVPELGPREIQQRPNQLHVY